MLQTEIYIVYSIMMFDIKTLRMYNVASKPLLAFSEKMRKENYIFKIHMKCAPHIVCRLYSSPCSYIIHTIIYRTHTPYENQQLQIHVEKQNMSMITLNKRNE